MTEEFSDADMYERMRNGWRMGAPETICGNGSTMKATQNARRWLPEIIREYGIASIVDAGAGDLAWIQHMPAGWVGSYTAVDLIPRLESVQPWDITKQVLPRADAILCRMVLNHIQPRAAYTTHLFRQSGARYLIATQYDAGVDRVKEFQRLDLREHFGAYLASCPDGDYHNGEDYDGCKLAIWKI